jgi:hypothetical protein
MSKTKIVLHTRRCKIEDAFEGMIVRSFNIETEQDEYREVLRTFEPIVEKHRQHELILGNGGTIVTSDIHPMLVFREKWIYVPTADVKVGDIVKDSTGTNIVLDIKVGREYDEQFADIEVAGNNNYYATSNGSATMYVVHNSATANYPGWHLEFEKLIELKNNKGTEETRIRTLDYAIALNGFMLRRLATHGNITLFSPEEVPDLYEAFYSPDTDKFEELYLKYENSNRVAKKTIPAVEFFAKLLNERFETGRIYLMFADTANTHTPFYESIYLTNLCVAGNTTLTIQLSDGSIQDVCIRDLKEFENQLIKVWSRNNKTGSMSFKPITHWAETSPKAKVVKITDEISGKSIICTPEHEIYTTNRGYVKAKDLLENDELLIT